MQILLTHKGDTITAQPHNTKSKLPLISRLETDKGITYAIANDIFQTRVLLGTIPAGYKMVSSDKYQIVFKTDTPPVRHFKQYRK